MPQPVTKDEAQAAVDQIAATVSANTKDPEAREAQLAAVRDLARLIDQTPDR